jgi:signal transduction histidine kinase
MDIETSYLIGGLALGWITLAAGIILYQYGRKWWRKEQFGKIIDHNALLTEYYRRLTHVEDRKALEQLLTEQFPLPLKIKQAILLIPEAYQLTTLDKNDLLLPVNHAAVRWVASSGEAQRADRGRLQELILQGRTDLSWTQVWVPLMRGSKLRGLWLLGQREENTWYTPEDLRWLTALAREAAAVLEAIDFAEQERLAASEMRALYRQMVKTREVERTRLSRELHDGVLQDLCAVTRDLKALEAQDGPEESLYTDTVNLSNESVRALRAICNDLRPPLLNQDLRSALKTMVGDMDSRSSAPVHIEISAEMNGLTVVDEAALAIFRITQEAVNNAIQHADASEIAVRLTAYPDRLRLTITDDGRGIPGGAESARFVAQGHFGLAGMRERAAMIGGKLEVQTAVDYGTVVSFELPRFKTANHTASSK